MHTRLLKAVACLLPLGFSVAAQAATEPLAEAAERPATSSDQRSAKKGWRLFSPDLFFAQVGRARETTTLTAGVQWEWARSWQIGENTLLTGYNEASIGHWRADNGEGSAIVTQVGLTPVLRFWPSGTTSGWFYEGGIGVNVLTPVYRTREKRFSTAFNFGDHLAVGYRSGTGRRVEWALRVQHFSNAGIQRPNPGEDFVQLRVSMPL